MNTEQAIEIIEALRCYIGTKNMEKREALRQAWSALREKQERENPQPLTLDELKERIDKLERERDAAVEDIKMIGTCILCKHNQYPCDREDNGHEKCFEWRGIKEGE